MTIDAMKAIINEIGGPEGVIGFRQANGTKSSKLKAYLLK